MIGMVPRQRYWRQSIGCFHSLSATLVAIGNNAAISGTNSFLEYKTAFVVVVVVDDTTVGVDVDVDVGLIDMWTTIMRCRSCSSCKFGKLPFEIVVGFELHGPILFQIYHESMKLACVGTQSNLPGS